MSDFKKNDMQNPTIKWLRIRINFVIELLEKHESYGVEECVNKLQAIKELKKIDKILELKERKENKCLALKN